MNDSLAELVLLATGTALATGLGAIPVFAIGREVERLRGFMLGVAAGVMAVAAVVGLLLPALDEGSPASAAAGLAFGVAFLLAARRWLGAGRGDARLRARNASILVFAVLFVHSLPEGFAVGTAYASSTEGLALFIVIAIAVQNIPEGTSVAIPMQVAGYGPARQFWTAVATSAPQPVGAVLAYVLVEQVTALLPLSFAFAAGAMLALVAVEVMPESLRWGRGRALAGAAVGGAVMLALGAVLSV